MTCSIVKKIGLGLMCVSVLSVNSFANKQTDYAHSSRSVSEKVDTNNKEKFFYNKGLSDGYEEGKKVGYQLAMRDARKAIKKYKRRIKALEAGKYLSKKGKITPPRVYQKKRADGTIAVVVKGCSVEGELNPNDILSFPTYTGEDTGANAGSYVSSSTTSSGSSSLSDSVELAGIDYVQHRKPSSPLDIKKATFRVFEDTQFNRELFRGAGLPYSIQPNSQLRVMFPSNKDAEGFIQRHGLVRGKDYK